MFPGTPQVIPFPKSGRAMGPCVSHTRELRDILLCPLDPGEKRNLVFFPHLTWLRVGNLQPLKETCLEAVLSQNMHMRRWKTPE